MIEPVVLLVSIVAGGVAGISGFGIGSLLTPLLAAHYGTKLAVAMVSVPHLVGTAARFIGLCKQLDRRIFIHFGLMSAAGGMGGALLNVHAGSPALGMALCLRMINARRHALCKAEVRSLLEGAR